MHIHVKILNDDERLKEWYENHPLHRPQSGESQAETEGETQSHPGDSGMDLYCPKTLSLDPMESGFIDFGIAIECFSDESCEKNVSCWLLPRSSTGKKTPIRLSNSMGLIDAGYRGALGASVDNFTKVEHDVKINTEYVRDEVLYYPYLTDTEHHNPYVIEEGSRLFQLASPFLDPITFEIVDELSTTSRGEGGFGSTGV